MDSGYSATAGTRSSEATGIDRLDARTRQCQREADASMQQVTFVAVVKPFAVTYQ